MKLTAFFYVVFIFLAGCTDPQWACGTLQITRAKAYRECSESNACWLSADQYAHMRYLETTYPQCFDGSVERE